MLRDRDAIYGEHFQQRIRNRGIKEVNIAPQSPWQNPYAERVIGSIRREALDHVIVLNERHLRRVLRSYVEYYYHWRTHHSLEMDTPKTRDIQPPELGPVKKLPEVGGLHHHYRKDIGHALYLVQTGHTPPSAKPMRGIESGVFEIVDDYDTDTYRAVYTVKVGSSLYILHAFMKKSKRGMRTPKREIDLIRRRLRCAREMEAEEEVPDE